MSDEKYIRCPKCGDCPRDDGISAECELDCFDVIGGADDDSGLFCQQCNHYFQPEVQAINHVTPEIKNDGHSDHISH